MLMIIGTEFDSVNLVKRLPTLPYSDEFGLVTHQSFCQPF